MAYRDSRAEVDADGVRTIAELGSRRGIWLVVSLLAALVVVMATLRWARQPERTDVTAGAPAGEARHSAAASPPNRPGFEPVRRPREPVEAPFGRQPAMSGHERSEAVEEPTSGDDAGGDGQPAGIALFPPPGTDPPKSGLIVPEGFPLPPGYVRHYQTTDDGRPLPPILMFHPDYEWVDESGRRLDLPADRIVPPELVPAGMPLQTLEVPETVIPFVSEPGPGESATD